MQHQPFFYLGDSRYPCLPWLFTPISHCTSPAQSRYNAAHSRTRIVNGQTFGELQSRFQCISLSEGLQRYALERAEDMFLACCICHNIALHAGRLQDIDVEHMEDEEDVFIPELSQNPRVNAYQQYFTW